MPGTLIDGGGIGIEPIGEVEPKPVGGHYYRVSEWDKDRPGLPVSPAVEKALWRRHNVYEDVIETTEALDGVKAVNIDSEGIPVNAIGNWTVGAFKGVERDAEAYRPFRLNAHLVKNHCVATLTYDDFQALRYYIDQHKDSTSLKKFQAAADLNAVKAVMPWGEAFRDGAPVLGLDGKLLTAKKLADAFLELCPVPVPKICEQHLEDGYEVLIQDRQPQLKTVEEVAKNDPYKECGHAKVSGWSPNNAYVGAVQVYYGAGSGTYQVTATTKVGQSFTTVGAFNVRSIGALVYHNDSSTPSGELVCELREGSTIGSGSLLASGRISVAELWLSSNKYTWIGIQAALAGATAYNIVWWLDGTVTTGGIQFRGNAAGTYAGGNAATYAAGAWTDAPAADLQFAVADDSNGGFYIARVDANSADLFGASGPKGAAVHSSDVCTITMGATLTRNGDHQLAGIRFGDTVQGSAMNTPAFGAQAALYRYGYEVLNAGVTATWTGAASTSQQGWYMNPTSADTSSKSCRLTFNGTAASPITCTNSTNSNNASYRWTLYNGYGSVQGTYFTLTFMHNGIAASGPMFCASSDKTTLTTATISDATINPYVGANQAMFQTTTNSDLTLVWLRLQCTGSSGAVWSGLTNSIAGFRWRLHGLTVPVGATAFSGPNFKEYIYLNQDTWEYAATPFASATPATFAAADAGTGDAVDFTVSNISDIAAGDFLVVYNSSDVEIGRCSRAVYEAALYDKPANTLRIGGFVKGTTYSGMYAKFTRDGVLFGPASGTVSATPNGGGGGGVSTSRLSRAVTLTGAN